RDFRQYTEPLGDEMKTIRTLLAALMISCLGLSAARADEPKPTPTQEQPKAAAGVLNDASLIDMLEMRGYKVKEEKMVQSMIYSVDVNGDGLCSSVTFQISPNKEKIWLIVALADITEEHK